MENILRDYMPRYYETLPIHPQPYVFESFTSYLRRLAAANGIQSLSCLAPLCFPVQTLENLADYPLRSFGKLSTISSCSESTLRATTFFHLGRKFGRTTVHNSYRWLLSKSIAQSLRYCPYCLSERRCYSLEWRFLSLTGCYEHNCQLLDSCAHCGGTIPLFALLPSIWMCPSCKGDLRVCKVHPLTEDLQQQSLECSRILEFLLSPQPWESSVDNLEQRLGQQLAHLRQARGLSLNAVANEAKFSIRELENIEQVEYGYVGPAGINLQSYFNYAAYLGVTIPELFHAALLQKVERGRPGRDLSDEDAFKRVQEAIHTLKDRGEKITYASICKLAQINHLWLVGFPRAWALVESTITEIYAEERERRSTEMLERVQSAVNQLKASGLPVTKAAVGQLISKRSLAFYSYPQVLELFRQNSLYFHEPEDELLTKIETFKRQLEEQGKLVTQFAITKQFGLSRRTLMRYPRIRTLMENIAAKSRHHRLGSGRQQRARLEEE